MQQLNSFASWIIISETSLRDWRFLASRRDIGRSAFPCEGLAALLESRSGKCDFRTMLLSAQFTVSAKGSSVPLGNFRDQSVTGVDPAN